MDRPQVPYDGLATTLTVAQAAKLLTRVGTLKHGWMDKVSTWPQTPMPFAACWASCPRR